MGQFRNFIGLLDKLESENIAVHPQRCAVVRNRHATCRKCVDACTSGCISIVDEQLKVDTSKCIGCGTCATVCPTGALESLNPTDAELFSATLHAMRALNGTAVIACEEMLKRVPKLYDPDKVASVVCLGRVDESLIALMGLAEGKEVVMVCSDCENCPHAPGRATAELVCETANHLLEVWNNPLRARISDKLPGKVRRKENPDGYDKQRREVFGEVASEAKTVAAQTAAEQLKLAPQDSEKEKSKTKPLVVKVNERGVIPQHIPTRRTRLLKTLSEMGEPSEDVISCRLWGEVEIDTEKCNSCQMCATFCPTGALTRYRDDNGEVGIEHYAGCCVKCRTCTDICPQQALILHDEVLAPDLMHGFVEKYPMDEPEARESGVHQIRESIGRLVTHSKVSDH